jgi:hypothetical protein
MEAADRITASIGEFCILSGLGRTKIYELLGAGELDSILIGKRRLVIVESYRRLIERQRAARAQTGAAPPAPRTIKCRGPS